VQTDPVNFVDPGGLFMAEPHWNWWDDPLFWRFMFWTPNTGSYPGFDPGGPGPGTETPQNPQKTPEQQRCDDKLANIFGGADAVAAGNGFEPKGGKDPAYDGTYRGYGQDISDRAMHLYGNGDKTATTGVYLPGKIDSLYPNPQTLPEYKGGSFVAFYSNLNGLQNVSLIVTHLAGFTRNSNDVNEAGSRYIGTTGGLGGEGVNYVHAHFELVQGKVKRGRSTKAMKHYSFAKVFCK
jgi:hypothetical protein